ncbi:hypothetical protein M422DRAFT_246903 [Sphaerobolus stellatus SS14]|nr:hypothetical protein M422DRAFT_246903 [Sphaerobolus stellatus SS14]
MPVPSLAPTPPFTRSRNCEPCISICAQAIFQPSGQHSLAREAAFYREYRTFQGIVIPKC